MSDRRKNDPLADIVPGDRLRDIDDGAPFRVSGIADRRKEIRASLYGRRCDDCTSNCIHVQDAFARLRALHRPYHPIGGDVDELCESCYCTYPCPTIRALDPRAVSNTEARVRAMKRAGMA